MNDWGERKIQLAEKMAAGECGGSYAEAILIISSVLSGIASDLWPGRDRDKKRFVQLWATFSSAELHPNRISIPLLLDHLEEKKRLSEADAVRAMRPRGFAPRGLPDTLVVTGDDVDVDEAELLAHLSVSLGEIRAFSYGNVFYEHFRSGYVHEYGTGTHGDEYVMSQKRGPITYGNWMEKPHRRINFSVAWLASVARSIWLNSRTAFFDQAPLPDPEDWWLPSRGAASG